MENNLEKQWFNGTHDGVWPSLNELQFAFSEKQTTLTITHKDGKSIGITFPEFLRKMQESFEKKQDVIAGKGSKNDLKWIVDNGNEEIDYYLENITNDQLKIDVYELIRKSGDKLAIQEAIATLQKMLQE